MKLVLGQMKHSFRNDILSPEALQVRAHRVSQVFQDHPNKAEISSLFSKIYAGAHKKAVAFSISPKWKVAA